MCRCCCGKITDIDEMPMVLNDYQHEILGPERNFCGPKKNHLIRDLQARVETLELENERLGVQSRALLDRLQKQNGILHITKLHWMNSSHEDECPCIGPDIFDDRCLCGYDVFQAALWEAGLITQAEIDFKCGEDVPKPESWWTPEYKKGDDDEVQDN